MNKRNKIIYYIATGLLTAIMGMSVMMYLFNYDEVAITFHDLGYSSSLIYPLALAKTLGLIAIWTNRSRLLKEMAYVGFSINLSLAIVAHLMIRDGMAGPAVVALILLAASYLSHRKLFAGSISLQISTGTK